MYFQKIIFNALLLMGILFCNYCFFIDFSTAHADDLDSTDFQMEKPLSAGLASDQTDGAQMDEYLSDEQFLEEPVIPDISVDEPPVEDPNSIAFIDDEKVDTPVAKTQPSIVSLKTNAEYEEKYGKTLSGVPYALKLAYSTKNDTEWVDADYEERTQFIRTWEQEVQAEQNEKAAYEQRRKRDIEEHEATRKRGKANEEQRIQAHKQDILSKKRAEKSKEQAQIQAFNAAKQRMEQLKAQRKRTK